MPQRGDGCLAFGARVYEVFGQCADDAVAAGKDLADPRLVLTRRLDNAAGARVDDRGHAARLGIERVLFH